MTRARHRGPRLGPPGCDGGKMMFGSLLLVIFLTAQATSGQQSSSSFPQQQQQLTMIQQSMAQLLQVFHGSSSSGNESLEANHFKLLEREGDFLLVGARNVVYNLSLSSMREQRRLEWPSSEDDVRMCRVKGKREEQCQNYIRVLKLQAPDSLLVCGTNAYKPRCRTYLVTPEGYELVSETPGEGACPYQENQNVTSVFTDGHLYSATATQFSGIDGLIHRAPLRTEQFNPKQLNSPNFVSSFRYGDHVYFLFRETAIEHINCGKTVYSRIARVCLNDQGGSSSANRGRWTSFLKARLNCSIPGEFPFYFDEIQASTGVVQSSLGDLLYAVFTTPTNSIGGSAVCAFRMSDVLAAFEGPFKGQQDSNSNWLPVPESRLPPGPRPGATCTNDSRQLGDETINFIKDHPLMDQAVEALWSQPLITMASINFRFTQIAVDSQVETQMAPGAGSMRTDVIFVSTDDGRVFKLVNTHHLHAPPTRAAYHAAPYTRAPPPPLASPQVLSPVSTNQRDPPPPDVASQTVVIEELHLFDSRTPIVNLKLYHGSSAASKLLVLSSKQLKAIPLSRCERALTCADCLALYDPYCAWDLRQHACLAVGASSSLHVSSARSAPRSPHQSSWFPANSLASTSTVPANNHTLAWWLQCPSSSGEQQQQLGAVGAPFRSLFSSHLQVPSRFDYASNHHLSHTALVALQQPSNLGQQHYRQPPASECLTFCGGLYTPVITSGGGFYQAGGQAQSEQLMLNCADYVQQHYIGSNGQLVTQTSPNGGGGQMSTGGGHLYTSENLYFAVIICALAGLLLGLLFGFALGRNTRKHDSSVCSSTFDETNLYMASTGSHHGGANHLFAQQQQQQQRQLHHPLLQQSNGIRPSLAQQQQSTAATGQNLFEANQCLLPLSGGGADQANYGNQQQMLLHLATNHQATGVRSGALPPLPNQPQQQQQQQQPLVTNQTQISHAQLTPNSLSGASSTNTSSTSATVPANDSHHHHQLYLNHQQAQQQQQQQQQQVAHLHQRSNSSSMKGKSSFLQQPPPQMQQQNNKIYL